MNKIAKLKMTHELVTTKIHNIVNVVIYINDELHVIFTFLPITCKNTKRFVTYDEIKDLNIRNYLLKNNVIKLFIFDYYELTPIALLQIL